MVKPKRAPNPPKKRKFDEIWNSLWRLDLRDWLYKKIETSKKRHIILMEAFGLKPSRRLISIDETLKVEVYIDSKKRDNFKRSVKKLTDLEDLVKAVSGVEVATTLRRRSMTLLRNLTGIRSENFTTRNRVEKRLEALNLELCDIRRKYVELCGK